MERDVMPVDVVFVGAGPANLAAAWKLCKILEEQGRSGDFEITGVDEQGDYIWGEWSGSVTLTDTVGGGTVDLTEITVESWPRFGS